MCDDQTNHFVLSFSFQIIAIFIYFYALYIFNIYLYTVYNIHIYNFLSCIYICVKCNPYLFLIRCVACEYFLDGVHSGPLAISFLVQMQSIREEIFPFLAAASRYIHKLHVLVASSQCGVRRCECFHVL